MPKGKLTAAASTDAGREPGRAAASRITARDASVTKMAQEAGQQGAGGTASHVETPATDTQDSEDAGASPPDDLEPNGQPCSASSDCASGNCKTSPDGRRCFGLIAVDKACTGQYDCDGYACVPATADGKSSVCVDASKCGTHDPCAKDYWAATCQLDQLCSAQPSSFNQCYQKACTRPRDAKELCASELAVAKGLIASRCCPPAGAYHSTCDPAPQCGCKNGEKCDVAGSDGQTTCGPAGTATDGQPCSSPGDCAAGYACTKAGCKHYCDGPNDTVCGARGACKPFAFGETYAPGTFACSHSCDPTSSDTANGPFDACRPGLRCEPAVDGHSDCFPGGGSGRQGASCNKDVKVDNQACAPGFGCITGSLTCAQYCKVAVDDCPVGTCHSNVGNKMFAFDVEIGYCAAP